jgi:hypothetical protein
MEAEILEVEKMPSPGLREYEGLYGPLPQVVALSLAHAAAYLPGIFLKGYKSSVESQTNYTRVSHWVSYRP